MQGEAADRDAIDDIYRINVRSTDGEMVPLRSLVEVRPIIGPQALIRYNNRVAATVQGSPAPGVSSGQSLAAMEQVAAKTLPRSYQGLWTDISFQEKRAEGKTAIILGLAVLFAYLFLVALYESWTIPIPVLLSVTVGVLGSYAGILARRSHARFVCADRHDRADRACRKERHPDRRVCQGTPAALPCWRRRPRGHVCASVQSTAAAASPASAAADPAAAGSRSVVVGWIRIRPRIGQRLGQSLGVRHASLRRSRRKRTTWRLGCHRRITKS